MWRYGFTLWFALTALLGPGVCYRALAASVARLGGPTAPVGGEPAHAPDAIQFIADPENARPGESQPPSCPPGQGKRANALPPTSTSDLAAELRLPVGAVPVPPLLVIPVPLVGNPTGPACTHLSTRLAGRDLLAVYCLLRC